jgi:hypothetical protein
VDYDRPHTDGLAFENGIFLPDGQQARPMLNAQNTVSTAASSIAGNDFNSPIHAATSDAQIGGLGMPEYPPYGPLTEKTMVLEHQFDQDFRNEIAVGAFSQMYDGQLGSRSNSNTGAQVGLQAEIDPQRYSMSVSGQIQLTCEVVSRN